MQIRPETSADWPAVYAIHAAAFPTQAEAELVSRLRTTATPIISLVAEHGAAIVGHILFTPVTLADSSQLLMGLAPVAVTPALQNQGVGAALISAGLEQCLCVLSHGICQDLVHPELPDPKRIPH